MVRIAVSRHRRGSGHHRPLTKGKSATPKPRTTVPARPAEVTTKYPIRRVTTADATEMISLDKKVFGTTGFGAKFMRETLRTKELWALGATDKKGGRLIGAVLTKPREGALYVSYIGVLPKYQSKKIGTVLMNRAIRHAGTKPVTLHVRVSNDRAIGFYRKLGFAPRNVIEKYYRKPSEAALFMERPGKVS